MSSIPDADAQPRRWRSLLLLLTLAGFVFALLSGSQLLFFGGYLTRREYWELTHWGLGLLGLVPYTLYQLRHYLRVRGMIRQTHYRAGVYAFFLLCATFLTGAALLVLVERGASVYTAVDLAHIFFGFLFTIFLSAHLTLVALLTVARAPEALKSFARASLQMQLLAAAILAVMLMILAFGLRNSL